MNNATSKNVIHLVRQAYCRVVVSKCIIFGVNGLKIIPYKGLVSWCLFVASRHEFRQTVKKRYGTKKSPRCNVFKDSLYFFDTCLKVSFYLFFLHFIHPTFKVRGRCAALSRSVPCTAGLDRSRKQPEEALWTSTKRLGERNENAFRTTNITEQVYVFVLDYLSNEFSPMGLQTGKDVFDVLDGKHDATDT